MHPIGRLPSCGLKPSQDVDQTPLIVHVIYHLGVGGLENGLVNLINHIPPDRYRHAIVCLKGYTDFRARIKRQDVEVLALNKREGNDLGLYMNLFKTLRRLKPDIVHTRNLGTMEGQLLAVLAGARARIHGEHGRDMSDLHGKNRKYNLLRRAIRPFVSDFIAVSKDLEDWLVNTVGASPLHVNQIYNGVDSVRFYPREAKCFAASCITGLPHGFITEDSFVVGSGGRMADEKNFPILVQPFIMLLKQDATARARLRLFLIGDGNSRNKCVRMLQEAEAEMVCWLPGERADIPELMRIMDLFVLPSLAEGISNTVLEAMSTGLPVIATRVGGNVELVKEGITGMLVPANSPEDLAAGIASYYGNPALAARHGVVARRQIETGFSMKAMTQRYLQVYDQALGTS